MRKPSEILAIGLEHYKAGGYMCHTLSELVEDGVISEEERVSLVDPHIMPPIQIEGCHALVSMLLSTDKVFDQLYNRHGWALNQYGPVHWYLVAWFEVLKDELEKQGK